MSASELSKFTMANNSNIPILKRNFTGNFNGTKKSKGCSKLPELQRYIETIIKASKEFDSENTSLSDKEKFSKARQFGKPAVYKGIEHKIKHEKLKFDVISNRCKSKRQTSKIYSEAVSRGVHVLHKFVSEFEDPRNWQIPHSGSHLMIEKLIKKFYPNPYKISCENECQNSESQIIFEKNKKDDLGDEVLYDAFISKVDAETQDDLEKRDIDLAPADIQIIPSEREYNKSANLDPRFENLNSPLSRNKINNEEGKQIKSSNASKLNTVLNRPNKSSRIRYSSSLSNVNNRVGSIENINQLLCKESQIILKKRKNLKANTKISSKEILPKVENLKLLAADEKNYNDYDLGKLKLLNLSDSDDTTSEKLYSEQTEFKNKNNIATDDFVSEISSEICNEISKTNDLNDLLQIYEVMNKATESFLYLTATKKSGLENKKSIEVLNDLHNKEPNCQSEKDDGIPKLKGSESSHIENVFSVNEDKNMSDSPNEKKSDDRYEEKQKTTVENSLSNILAKDKKCSTKEKTFDPEIKPKVENEKLQKIPNEEEIIRFSNSNENEQTTGRKVEDEIFDANQKINEVLQFMNACLLKFSNDEKLLSQESKNYEEYNEKTTTLYENVANDNVEDEKNISSAFEISSYDLTDDNLLGSFLQTDFLNPKETQTNHIALVKKKNKNQNIKIQCKRKSEIVIKIPKVLKIKTNASSQQLSVDANKTISASDSNIRSALYAESVILNNENIIQVAEGQNELGGYVEESQESNIIFNEDSRVLKSVFPLSTKVRRSQPETYKTLKDALETEEKLLKLNKTEPNNLISCDTGSQILIENDTTTTYSPVGGFESLNSSFMICISPFPQNLGALANTAPNLSIPKPLSLSLIDFRSWNLKPLPRPTKEYHSEKLFIPPEIEHRVLKFMYSFKLGALLIVNNTWVIYCARPVCFAALINFPKIQREFSLEYSKRPIRVKPLKKISIMNLSTPGTSGFCIRNTVTFTTSKSNLVNTSESKTSVNANDKSMEALIKAIQETENVFLLQQHNSKVNNPLGNFESFCSCRSNEILKNEISDNELEKENDKKKVQDLLLRTYKLQNKLQQYLYSISQVEPTKLSRSLLKQDFGVTIREIANSPDVSLKNINIKPEKLPPLIHRPLQLPTADKNTKTDEAVTVNVQMVDCGTTYFPPSKEESQIICEKSNELKYKTENFSFETEVESAQNVENDEDDRSSTYSFKSSNDFSETNEIQNLSPEASGFETNGDVIKKIFSQIELLKHDAENLKKQEKILSDKINNSDLKEREEFKDNKLVEFDSKNPAKVLKTVFKGIKSSTELTIGLKDVPMTKVSNISVEKTKFSPNHTKISICISKESQNETNSSDNLDTKVLSNKVSSYFFDHMRPSLSMCHSEYSEVKDDVSKSLQSLNYRSDDDEDDFKSVGSNPANSNPITNPEKSKFKNQAVVKMSPSKNFMKHKFDFYRKMDMNLEGIRVRQKPLSNSFWRYKELEPLKQALTELQIRMRSIKREAILNSNDYYERALKLAKMSAGYCQSCGTRAVIPNDTFGYYKTLLPRRHAHHHQNKHFKTSITPNSSFYSFQSSNAEVSGQFCDLDIKRSSSFLLNRTAHSNRTILRSSLQDMPIVFEKM